MTRDLISPYRICYPFVGDSIGGSHKSALLLINELDRTRFEPVIVLHSKDGPLAEFLEADGIPFKVLPKIRLFGKNPSLREIFMAQLCNFIRLWIFIITNRIDLVHCNDFRCNLTWAMASKLFARHVWHQRTTLSSSYFWRLIGLLTNHVICISKTVRDTYRSFAPVTTVMNPFVHHNFSSLDARQLLRVELGVSNEQHVVGYVGRLVSGKGIEIFARLPALLPDSIFVVAGSGPLLNILPPDVRVLGFRRQVELDISGFDVLVAPSQTEGFGRTLVEAMLCGIPVVASDIPAHREVTLSGKLAVLIASLDPTDYATALEAIRDNPQLSNFIAQSALEHAESCYSAKSHVSQVEAIYLSFLRPVA